MLCTDWMQSSHIIRWGISQNQKSFHNIEMQHSQWQRLAYRWHQLIDTRLSLSFWWWLGCCTKPSTVYSAVQQWQSARNANQRFCKRQTVTIEETYYDTSEIPNGTTCGGDKFTVIRSYIRVKVIRGEDPCSDGSSVSDTAGCVETAGCEVLNQHLTDT